MEMTIDDAKYCLENGGLCSAICKYFSEGGPDCEDNVRKIALETMSKYQKIEKIVKAWNDMNSFDSMKQISEVLEDENNN